MPEPTILAYSRAARLAREDADAAHAAYLAYVAADEAGDVAGARAAAGSWSTLSAIAGASMEIACQAMKRYYATNPDKADYADSEAPGV